jgi:hypothetical protein
VISISHSIPTLMVKKEAKGFDWLTSAEVFAQT